MILYLVEVSLKWLQRIIKDHSLPDSTPLERKFEEGYQEVFEKLSESANICLQKELMIISANVEMGSVEFLVKYLILFRNMHRIIPTYSAENDMKVETNFTDKESKEKSKCFDLNFRTLYVECVEHNVQFLSQSRI